MVMLKEFDSFQSVAGRSGHFAAYGFPIHEIGNTFAHRCFIIYDQ